MVEQSPDYVAAYDLLSQTYHRMGKDDEAIEILRQRVENSPHKIDAQKRYATLLLNTDNYDEALVAFRHIVNNGSGSIFHDPTDHANLGYLYAGK